LIGTTARALGGAACLAALSGLAPAAAPTTASAPNAPAEQVVTAATAGELSAALRAARPGTTIRIAPGRYEGGFLLTGLVGTAEAPIVVAGAEAADPPVLGGEGSVFRGRRCAYVKLSGLVVRGGGDHAIRLEGDGEPRSRSHHVVVEDVTFRDVGGGGRCDALTLWRLDDVVIRRCRFEGWGGSAVELVGCRRAVVDDCAFLGAADKRHTNAMRIRGGSAGVLVQRSYFHRAGDRAISVGGSTKRERFRPSWARHEARHVVVAGNRFVGGEAHVACVTARGVHVHHNIFYRPGKWVLRILQESADPRLAPCRDGLIERNLVVTDQRVRVMVDQGERTRPETFAFRRNAWLRFDTERRPALPTTEENGLYQVDPALQAPGTARMAIGSQDPALREIGPGGYSPWRANAAFPDVRVAAIPIVAARQPLPEGNPVGYVILAGVGLLALTAVAMRVRPRRRRRRSVHSRRVRA
jgi:hypothetical protein